MLLVNLLISGLFHECGYTHFTWWDVLVHYLRRSVYNSVPYFVQFSILILLLVTRYSQMLKLSYVCTGQACWSTSFWNHVK